MKKAQVGIIGLGGMGRRRLQILSGLAGAEVACISTRNRDVLRQAADEHGISRVTTNWPDVVADAELDAVCVCVPNDLHFEIARAALENDKHVLVEYPLATTIEEIDILSQLARSRGRVLHVGLTERHEPHHLAVCDVLPALGDPVEAHGFMGWPGIWKWAGDPVRTGPYFGLANFHFVDQLVHLYGRPDWVSAKLWTRTEDGRLSRAYGSMFFGYPDRFTGYVGYGLGMPAAQSVFLEFQLIHTDGMLQYRDGRLWVNRSHGRKFSEIPLGENESNERDTEAFVEEVLQGRMSCDLEETLISARLCILAQRSAEEGSRLVEYAEAVS